MGINDTCTSKSNTDNLRIRHTKEAAERYYRENPDSLIPLFEKELRELGFDFEVSSQTFGFIPKYKKERLRFTKQSILTLMQKRCLSRVERFI